MSVPGLCQFRHANCGKTAGGLQLEPIRGLMRVGISVLTWGRQAGAGARLGTRRSLRRRRVGSHPVRTPAPGWLVPQCPGTLTFLIPSICPPNRGADARDKK